MLYCTLYDPKFISINPDLQLDLFYRYKTPQLLICHVKGTTYLKNLNQVATALHCPSAAIVKYLSAEIGCQGNVNKSTLSGIHTPERLSDIIQDYIISLILCTNCLLPEVNHKIKKKQLLMECRSCGFRGVRFLPTSLLNSICS